MSREKKPNDLFYEIDYDASPVAGVGKYVLRSQPIKPPVIDEVRRRFNRMREIARLDGMPGYYGSSRFYDQRVQRENARVFYKQAKFMQDFVDSSSEHAELEAYYPNYQMMSYEQLRTYFTWRTGVRQGRVEETSLSYAYLYVYELLNNIGAETPQEGLDRLLSFWQAYRVFDHSMDRYMYGWLKDYHIYYPLDHTFADFAAANGITEKYPELARSSDAFARLVSLSKYDIRKSVFCTAENRRLIEDCAVFVMKKVGEALEDAGIRADGTLFYPYKQNTPWLPFKGALFYNWLRQPDRRIEFSENELYACIGNVWYRNTEITSEKGRRLVGYVLKEAECVLRKLKKFKYKLTANINSVDPVILSMLTDAGRPLEQTVKAAVLEFYREATKVVVTVDRLSLDHIREEALATQEALTVEELPPQPVAVNIPEPPVSPEPQPSPVDDGWAALKEELSETELAALVYIINGGDLETFAAENSIMPEVLADGINEKAADHIGDSLLDEELILYEDYTESIKGMIS